MAPADRRHRIQRGPAVTPGPISAYFYEQGDRLPLLPTPSHGTSSTPRRSFFHGELDLPLGLPQDPSRSLGGRGGQDRRDHDGNGFSGALPCSPRAIHVFLLVAHDTPFRTRPSVRGSGLAPHAFSRRHEAIASKRSRARALFIRASFMEEGRAARPTRPGEIQGNRRHRECCWPPRSPPASSR